MDEDPRDREIRTLREALRSASHEAAAARSALCENELVIRLDNILALARTALVGTGDSGGQETEDQGTGAPARPA